ncbi:MAG TPA: hypothetical protein VES67_01070 [Vicinamibacterales bacterium]|nr:hypothetical protein [Vicinamibacterales bacterium]
MLAIVSVAACQLKLPTAPSELTEGIVIYQDSDYLGPSAHVTKDIANLQDYAGPCNNQDLETKTWGDCISSIRVAPGWRATIFERTDYRGEFLNVVEDTPNLVLVNGTCRKGGLNDCILSIRVSRP